MERTKKSGVMEENLLTKPIFFKQPKRTKEAFDIHYEVFFGHLTEIVDRIHAMQEKDVFFTVSKKDAEGKAPHDYAWYNFHLNSTKYQLVFWDSRT